MPHYWIAIATPDDLKKDLRSGDWAKAKQRIFERLRDEGLGLDEVYFDQRTRTAYALGHSPKKVKTSGLKDSLGADALELLTVEELQSPESTSKRAD